MSYDWDKINELVSEISKYTELDGPTSETEAIECLCGAIGRPDYISESLLVAITQELSEKLRHYKENTKIVEREETYTRTVVDLEWDL